MLLRMLKVSIAVVLSSLICKYGIFAFVTKST